MTQSYPSDCIAITGGLDVIGISLNQKVFSMTSTGHLFWSAIKAVLWNFGTALKVFWLPFAVSTFLFTLLAWYDPYGDSIGLNLLNSVIDLLLFGMIAIGWHRFRLIDEQPSWYGAKISFEIVFNYAVNWLFVSVCTMLIVAFIVIPTVLLSGIIYKSVSGPIAIAQIHAGNLPASNGIADYIAKLVLEFNIIALLSLFCVFWLTCTIFFRIAIRLPAVSIESERQWSKSRTLPSYKTIISGAFWGAIYWFLTIFVSIWLEEFIWSDLTTELSDNSPIFSLAEVVYPVLMNTFYGINVLFGASYLTELFLETSAKGPFLGASPQ